MARRVFFSFHFRNDNWRAGQVRNMGIVEGNAPVSDNDWEDIKRKGDANIKRWIDSQLNGRSCIVVLVGSGTAGRKWIKYEIERSWDLGKGVVGICIHKLANSKGKQSVKGKNPFLDLIIENKNFGKVVKLYNPPHQNSKNAYAYIQKNISKWTEEAIRIRNKY